VTGAAIDRAVLIVLDSVGVGSLPDAAGFGDEGANTLVHVAERCGGLRLPHLGKLGLGNIVPVPGVLPVTAPLASWGRMAERSRGKDTLNGHWELMGLVLDRPFALFPGGGMEKSRRFVVRVKAPGRPTKGRAMTRPISQPSQTSLARRHIP